MVARVQPFAGRGGPPSLGTLSALAPLFMTQSSMVVGAKALGISLALALWGCMDMPEEGAEIELATDQLDKAYTIEEHGNLTPNFGYRVSSDASVVHRWTYESVDDAPSPLLVRRSDSTSRVAYLKIYEIVGLDAHGQAVLVEVEPTLGARDIVNEPSPRVITFQAGKRYQLDLIRLKPTTATLTVSLGDFGEDGRTEAMPDYFFDFTASPQIRVLGEHTYAAGAALPAAYAMLLDQTLALGDLDAVPAEEFALHLYEMRYGGFRFVGVFATQACDAGLRAGALFVQDLVNEATQDDDGPVEAFRFISDTGLMTALP